MPEQMETETKPVVIRESSVLHKDSEYLAKSQAFAPTWAIIIFLIITFYVLKSFIYIKDPGKDGK